MSARSDAAGAVEARPVSVLEIDADACANTYGVAPCTAAAGVGHECYYRYAGCQDKAHFVRAVQTDRFCSRGMAVPAGETIRPYVMKHEQSPTEIEPAKGLARRGETSFTLEDEPCEDHLEDRHWATRPVPAAGTYWSRYLARNTYLPGRFARAKTGYVTDPFSWATFDAALYVIVRAARQDVGGPVVVTLKDPVSLLDSAMLPPPSSGKLAVALPAFAYRGVVVSATPTTVTLPSSGDFAASAEDDAYNGMELWLYANTGAGQRVTVTDYVGATRVCTVSPAWVVTPDATTSCEIGALGLTLASGAGADYPDPAVTGLPEFVRCGKETIRYTAKAGDVLSWPATTYRAQFGSAAEDHKVGDLVQECLAFIDRTPMAVAQRLLNGGGILDAYIDLAGLAAGFDTWCSGVLITDCLSTPEKVSTLLADLLIDLGGSGYFDPLPMWFKVVWEMPELGTAVGTLTDDDLVHKSLRIEPMDSERITSQTMFYALANRNEDRKKNTNYLRGLSHVDGAAMGPNEWADDRPAVRHSHWMGTANDLDVAAWCARTVGRLRDVPLRIGFTLHPRSEVTLGSLVSLQLAALCDDTGAPKPTTVRVVRVKWVKGKQEVTARTTSFGLKYSFYAPDAAPDYASATAEERAYSYFCDDAGLMPNGDAGDVFI